MCCSWCCHLRRFWRSRCWSWSWQRRRFRLRKCDCGHSKFLWGWRLFRPDTPAMYVQFIWVCALRQKLAIITKIDQYVFTPADGPSRNQCQESWVGPTCRITPDCGIGFLAVIHFTSQANCNAQQWLVPGADGKYLNNRSQSWSIELEPNPCHSLTSSEYHRQVTPQIGSSRPSPSTATTPLPTSFNDEF